MLYTWMLFFFFFSENIFGSSFNNLSDVGEFKGDDFIFQMNKIYTSAPTEAGLNECLVVDVCKQHSV